MRCLSVIGAFLSTVSLSSLLLVFLVASPALAIDVIWDGGDGAWNDEGKWNGLEAVDAMGQFYGLQIGSEEVGTDVFINDGNVVYDPNTFGDFRFLEVEAGNGGTLTISDGASLSMNTNVDHKGKWTQFNADSLNLDNGTFRRTRNGSSRTAGVFSFGGIRGHENMDIEINLTNGGRIENDGQLTFGWYEENHLGRKVTMTINGGHLDLTGGDKWDQLDGATQGAGNADLQFHMGWDSNLNAPIGEDYAINFTGPGSIKVDHSGILVVHQTGPGFNFDASSITNLVTYQELWNQGILQANGSSGLDGETFSSFFSVAGSSGSDDYILTSLVGVAAGVTGDYNGNGVVDAADYTLWLDALGTADPLQNNPLGGTIGLTHFNQWKTNFGNSSGVGVITGTSVPEPSALVLMLAFVSTFFCRWQRR